MEFGDWDCMFRFIFYTNEYVMFYYSYLSPFLNNVEKWQSSLLVIRAKGLGVKVRFFSSYMLSFFKFSSQSYLPF